VLERLDWIDGEGKTQRVAPRDSSSGSLLAE